MKEIDATPVPVSPAADVSEAKQDNVKPEPVQSEAPQPSPPAPVAEVPVFRPRTGPDFRPRPSTQPIPAVIPLFLAWCAALLEAALVLCLLTGAFFTPAALVAAAYVLFLGFAFHGPSHWAGNQAEFGFFVDHFSFMAGLLFAAVHGPGRVLALNLGWPGRA